MRGCANCKVIDDDKQFSPSTADRGDIGKGMWGLVRVQNSHKWMTDDPTESLQRLLNCIADGSITKQEQKFLKNWGYLFMRLPRHAEQIKATPNWYNFNKHTFTVGKQGQATLYSIQHDAGNYMYAYMATGPWKLGLSAWPGAKPNEGSLGDVIETALSLKGLHSHLPMAVGKFNADRVLSHCDKWAQDILEAVAKEARKKEEEARLLAEVDYGTPNAQPGTGRRRG